MPYKDPEKRKAYSKKYGADWYQRNKKLTLDRSAQRKKDQRREWQEFKATLACEFCGASHPAIIDFHHPESEGETKVSDYVRAGRWKKAHEEAAKCIPLCSNCHRIHHWQRYNE